MKPAAVAEVPAELVAQEVGVARNTRTRHLGNTCQVGRGRRRRINGENEELRERKLIVYIQEVDMIIRLDIFM